MSDGESELFALAHVAPDESVTYGDHPSQVVDIYRPAGPPHTRVTLLHGGFWREAYDRCHLSPLAAALAAGGVEVFLAEYRRVGGGGGWPETFEDVARVAADAGRGAPGRHVLAGHSAGGHLALWAAGAAGVPPCEVVAVAPVADLGRARTLRLGAGAVDALLGGAYRPEADPVRLPPPRGPVTLLHGGADPHVPAALSTRYTAAARAAGGEITHRELPGVGHFTPVTPGTPACAELLALLGARARST
ncbi:alpha/beta hydrolase [Streptomyces sp. NPDC046215]|uniref:Alpha/beta hydrolase n=1 Tax=Streptomyces stramineus TaxID=173861 RepID=A0ABN1A7L4_9ACTN